MTIAQSIRQHIGRIAFGKPFTVAPFLRYGSRAAVDQTLSRLAKAGQIMRVARGVYVRPKTNPYLGKVAPGLEAVVRAKTKGETLEVHGAQAAQALGLTTQLPTRPVYYTSGPSRRFWVGRTLVTLRHAASQKLALAGHKAGQALVALWYLGREQTTPEVIRRLWAALQPNEQTQLLEAPLVGWMQRLLRPLAGVTHA